MKRIGVGIIGTGIFAGRAHLPAISSLPNQFKLVAACNRSKDKLMEFGSLAGINEENLYMDYSDLLKRDDVEAVLICLPPAMNLEVSVAAAKHKKHILLEKPISIDLESGRKICALPSEYGVVVMIGENHVFRKNTELLAAIIERGIIGEVITFNFTLVKYFNPNSPYMATLWRQYPVHPGGFLSDGGVHDIAFLAELLGKVAEVSAYTRQIFKENGADDTLCVTMKMQSGSIGTFTKSQAACPPGCSQLVIFGRKGTIELSNDSNLTVRDNLGGPVNLSELFTEQELVLKEDGQRSVNAEWMNFYDGITNTEPVRVPPECGFHHLSTIISALESVKSGKKELVQSV